MAIKLKKSRFSRNLEREKELGNIFNKTSSGLSTFVPLVLAVFFAPALITTSLFSKEIILIIANFSLSLGYLTNFGYRIYRGEVSKSELLISCLTLAAFLAVSFFLFPPIGVLSVINVLFFINQMAAVVNLFFLIKDVVVPPCKRLVEKFAQYLGYDIADRYYVKAPLQLEKDRFVIDQLLVKVYNHDSVSPKFERKELDGFNRLLNKISQYISKYDESVFGYIKNKEAIAALDQQVMQLITQGNPDSSYTFIRKKISFKQTKLQLLKTAALEVSESLENPCANNQKGLTFFTGLKAHDKKHPEKALRVGLNLLQLEIQRQQHKITSLQDCLPLESTIQP